MKAFVIMSTTPYSLLNFVYIAEKITIITILQHRKDAGTTLLR